MTEDAAEAADNNVGDQVPTVTPVEVRDLEAQADGEQGVVVARRMENLITESIAEGVELGIAKALSAIEARFAVAAPTTGGNQVATALWSGPPASTQPGFSLGSAALFGDVLFSGFCGSS